MVVKSIYYRDGIFSTLVSIYFLDAIEDVNINWLSRKYIDMKEQILSTLASWTARFYNTQIFPSSPEEGKNMSNISGRGENISTQWNTFQHNEKHFTLHWLRTESIFPRI